LEGILPVDIVDFKILRKDWYFFDWKMEKNQLVHRLLVKVSKENKGSEKNMME
jgi:hypothetical protein